MEKIFSATGAIDTGGKFAAGVVDTSGKLPLVRFAAGMFDTFCIKKFNKSYLTRIFAQPILYILRN
jgi:hypothetical protein